jgi:hypothetical protein
MPGRTPHEAFEAFITPIERASSCLGSVKVKVSPGGSTAPNMEHAWSLNGIERVYDPRLALRGEHGYTIISDDRPGRGPWRVRTLQYRYRLAVPEHDVFRLHWHPNGRSPVTYPHLHAALEPKERMPGSLDAHLTTGRMTLEDALRWAFELGMPAARDDWPKRLAQEAGRCGGGAPAAPLMVQRSRRG